MKKIISIIKKNFKLILRSRISALIILLGPLFIILIVGIAFNSTGDIKINVGYYTPEQSEMADSFIGVLGKTNYKLVGFDSIENCRISIASGVNHLCVIFPTNFNIGNNQVNEITFLVDNSKINFYETVVDSIEQDFNERALQLSQGMTQELLNKLNETQGSIENKSQLIQNMKEENKMLHDDVRAISNEVSNLDLNFNSDELSLGVLEDETDDLFKSYDELETIAKKLVEESLDVIDDVEDVVEDLNISATSKNDLLDKLNDSAENILDLEDDLNKTKSSNMTGLEDIIDDLKDEITSVDTKFNQASSARDISVDKITKINTKLDASLSKIFAVEETMNAIYKNINSTEITNLDSITKPIKKNVQPVVSGENQLNFFFPYLILLIIMFIGLLLSSTLVVMEKSSRAHFRNFVTPTNDIVFLLGSYCTTFMIMFFQLSVILAIFGFYFGRDIFTNFKSTFFILFFLVTLFSWLGMFIGNLFNSEETSTLASISISSILLFVSDLIFPLERMPENVSYLARTYNPFVIGTELLRKTMVHRIPIAELGQELYILVFYLVIIFTIMFLAHKIMKRSYLLQWGGYIVRRKLRKQEKHSIENELLKHYSNIKEVNFFETKDKKKIPTLLDLLKYIQSIDAETFKFHVNDKGNDIAIWVNDVLKNEELAQKVMKAKTKIKLVKVLEKGLKKYDKIAQKSSKHIKKKN
jgi:ABC-type multidrug transport system permease subunit